jgi:protoporphyrinogen oxidase
MEETAKKTQNKKVVVIGAGPAGLTASYQLSRAGVESIVLEKDQTVGGISRTVNYKDYHFDIGGHRFFTKIDEVDRMWQSILDDDFLKRERLSRIYYDKKFFYYPLRPFNALLGLGLWNSILILGSYLLSRLIPSKPEETFEQWVSNRFGKRLYHIFFKTYTEKVWGISCNEIRAEWAAQRIKGLSLVTAIKDSLMKSQNNSHNKQNVIKTLVDQFHYPKLGPGMMWRAVAEKIQSNGSEVRMEAEVTGIVCSEKRVEAVEAKRNGKLDRISGTDFICSMPIRELVQKIKPPVPKKILDAANNLQYRDFITVALIINKGDVFPDNWIYIHDPDVKVGRIQNFKNWSPYMVPDQSKTCLGLEYFCFENDPLWKMSDRELIDLGVREMEALGFANQRDVLDGTVVRMPKAYPVYDSKDRDSVTIIRDYLDQMENLHLVGRNGQHKYNNQDHSMLTGMMAAKNVLGGNHNLWKVNEETEYHEEMVLKPLMRAFSRLDKFGFATALGSVSGLFTFLATIFLVIKGGEVVGPNLRLLNEYFFGYTVTLKGAFIGASYSFLWAFIFGWLVAYLRNFFVGFFIYRIQRKAEMLSFRDFLDHF